MFVPGNNQIHDPMGLIKNELYFKLQDVEGELKLEYAPCLMRVYHNGRLLKRSGRKGYEVATVTGEKEYFKVSVNFTLSHIIEFRGQKINLESPLSTWEYIVGGLPLVLIVAGGLIGALIGFVGVTYNYGFMRSHTHPASKIAASLAVTAIVFFIYFVAALLLSLALGTYK